MSFSRYGEVVEKLLAEKKKSNPSTSSYSTPSDTSSAPRYATSAYPAEPPHYYAATAVRPQRMPSESPPAASPSPPAPTTSPYGHQEDEFHNNYDGGDDFEDKDVVMGDEAYGGLRRDSDTFRELVMESEHAEWMVELDMNEDADEIGMSRDAIVEDEDIDMNGTLCLAFLVVDTNVLIKDLEKFKAFQQMLEINNSEGFFGWFVELVVPHIVLQELDALKKSDRVGTEARQCVNWLYTALKEKAYGLRFQKKPDSRVQGNNDDQVLECADKLRQFAIQDDRFEEFRVFLLTDDRNLSVKAMVANLQTISCDEFSESPEKFVEDFLAAEQF